MFDRCREPSSQRPGHLSGAVCQCISSVGRFKEEPSPRRCSSGPSLLPGTAKEAPGGAVLGQQGYQQQQGQAASDTLPEASSLHDDRSLDHLVFGCRWAWLTSIKQALAWRYIRLASAFMHPGRCSIGKCGHSCVSKAPQVLFCFVPPCCPGAIHSHAKSNLAPILVVAMIR